MRTKIISLVLMILLFTGVFGAKKVRAAESTSGTGTPNVIQDFIDYTSSPTSNVFQFIAGEVTKNAKGIFELQLKGVVGGILSTFVAQLGGINFDENGLPKDGALNLTSGAIASMYATPPASGVAYAYDVLHNLGVKSAYAASGVGFGSLQPILPIWKAFRNLSYAVFAIIFIVIGVMIMFRVKVSSQAVITIENSLPKVIAALILVTFSYAIAGALIDILYVITSLAVNAFSVAGVILVFKPQDILQSGFFAFIPPIAISTVGAGALGAMLVTTVGGPLMMTGGAVVGGVLFSLIWLIISLFLIIRLLIALIKTYIYIILAIIFGPLQIMMGAFPALPVGGFGSWIKGLFANILVFPAVAVVLVIGSSIVAHGPSLESIWYPPLITPPDLYLGDIFAVPLGIVMKSAIGLGMLLVLPGIPDMVRGMLGVKDQGFGGLVGQAIKGPLNTTFVTPTKMAASAVAPTIERKANAPGASWTYKVLEGGVKAGKAVGFIR